MAKKLIISKKEYAKICLECPYKKCHQGYNGCERTRKYKVQEHENNEKKN